MTKVGFIRTPVNKPTLPEAVVTLPNPGELTREPQSRPPMWVWVVLFVCAALGLMIILFRSGARTMGMGSLFIMPVMIMSALMMMRNRSSNSNTKPAVIGQTRADYMRKLDELREEVHKGGRRQAEEIAYHHPNPTQGALLTLVNTGRMWERSPQDRNFGHVRIGVGVSRLRTKIDPPANVPPPEYRETVTAVAARDFMLAQNVIHDVARPLHLFDQMGWSFFADPEQRPAVQAMLRAMVCQLCVWHGPDVVQVAIITDDADAWEWAKWLPHVRDRVLVDASGPARLIFSDVSDFLAVFAGNLLQRPAWSPRMDGGVTPQDWLVVVVDLPGANIAPIVGPAGHLGVSVLEATGDEMSPLATSATAFVFDDTGNLLRAQTEVT